MNLINGIVSEKEGKLYCKFDENNILLPEEKAKVLKETPYLIRKFSYSLNCI